MLQLQVIGRIGKDATVNTVNGKSVVNFSVAHSEKYRDAQGNTQEKTTWLDCSQWSDKTGIVPYLTKGTQVFVAGTPELRTYTKNDGTNGASLSVRVRDIQLLGSKNENGGAQNTNSQTAPAATTAPAQPTSQENFDGLPF